MSQVRSSWRIKRIRHQILVAMKMLYPAALQAEQLLRTLLSVFPDLEWDDFRRDLAYLCEKGYLTRVLTEQEGDGRLTPWRKRWFRLTSSGVEVADECVEDPAIGDG